MWQNIKQTLKSVLILSLVGVFFLSGFPSKDFFTFAQSSFRDRNIIDNLYYAINDKNVIDGQARFLLNSPVKKASASTFQMNSGYYVGSGGVQTITGLGFRPEMIILKSNSNSIPTVFHTNIMPDGTTSYLGTATNDSTAGFIQLISDGFKVYSTASTVNVRYTWVAFAGSDCTASGTMCIGSSIKNQNQYRSILSFVFSINL